MVSVGVPSGTDTNSASDASDVELASMSDVELAEAEFQLHEGHAFGNDSERNEVFGKEGAKVVDELVINLVDA